MYCVHDFLGQPSYDINRPYNEFIILTTFVQLIISNFTWPPLPIFDIGYTIGSKYAVTWCQYCDVIGSGNIFPDLLSWPRAIVWLATRADRLVRLEFAKNQYHRFSIALFIHLFLFKIRVTGIIRKRINWSFFQYICCFDLASLNVCFGVLKSIHSSNRGSVERYAI